jgi:hypothetical protein
LHSIGSRTNDHDAKRQCQYALLKLDAPVHYHEDIIVTAHSVQQLAVFDSGPPATGYGIYDVTLEFRGEAYG